MHALRQDVVVLEHAYLSPSVVSPIPLLPQDSRTFRFIQLFHRLFGLLNYHPLEKGYYPIKNRRD